MPSNNNHPKFNNIRTKRAFTLAEVLITLGIIGIVASLTIPTLIANYQKQAYAVGLKKAYSNSLQAFSLMANDAGTPGDLSSIFDTNQVAVLASRISPYFKASKTCAYPIPSSQCFTQEKGNTPSGVNRANYVGEMSYSFITLDGMSVGVVLFYQTTPCTTTEWTLTKVCGTLYVDVNGLKGPNNFGRDIFSFAIANDNNKLLYPEGTKEFDDWTTSCPPLAGTNSGLSSPNAGGLGCTERILEQSEMNY